MKDAGVSLEFRRKKNMRIAFSTKARSGLRRIASYAAVYAAVSFLFFFMAGGTCNPTTDPDPSDYPLTESDDVISNPFQGFVPWIGDPNPVYETTLQYANFAWRDIEPQPGVYNWARLEQNWGNIAQTGRRIGFRIAAAIPGEPGHADIPQWLVDAGVRMRPYSIDGSEGLAPDWDDSLFLAAHHRFIAALGARYDADLRVAWIDIGSYGFWGEWHVYLNDSLAATQEAKEALLEDYFNAFPTKPKVIAFDDDFATAYVAARGGGIRNDCLGERESNDWYLESLNRIDPALNEVWQNAIITGEFCGSEAGAIQGTTDRFSLNLDFVRQTHWSFLGPAGGVIIPQDEQHKANLDILLKTLGYRFVLRRVDVPESAARGDSCSVNILVQNKGVAPFYFRWDLVLYLLDAAGNTVLEHVLDTDIRTWLPGLTESKDRFRIPPGIATATYDVKLGVIDPMFGRPGVRFANTGNDTEGRTWVNKITVK